MAEALQPGDLSFGPAQSVSLPPASDVKKKGMSLLKAAGLIAAVTLLSKFLGAVRDWAVMYAYGTSMVSDAYYSAFQIPSFAIVLLGGLGGPFHTATVAVFSRLIPDQQPPNQRTRMLASTFLTLTGIVFLVLSGLTFLFAEPLLALILGHKNPDMLHIAAAQLRIMSPCIWVGGLVGILYGISNIYNCFLWPSLSPIALSITILIGLLLTKPDANGMVLAWATLAGGILQLLMQLPEFFRQRFSFKPAFEWKAPELRKAGELLFPATIGTTIGQLVTYVDMFFASQLQAGAWAAVTLSNRLMQLPIGILQTALLVPIFPRFSRAAADGDVAEIKRNFRIGVVSLWLISIPILILMMVYTRPLIQLIFQHGRFNAQSTNMLTTALIFQAFQMIPYFARDSITRVFYAYQDSKTPMLIGLMSIGLKFLLNWWLVPIYHIAGITFSITLMTCFNMLLLGILSKRHIQDLGFREMLLPFGKILLSGSLMACGMVLANVLLGRLLPQQTLVIALAGGLGMIVYCTLALKLNIPEAHYLTERLLGRFLRRLNRV